MALNNLTVALLAFVAGLALAPVQDRALRDTQLSSERGGSLTVVVTAYDVGDNFRSVACNGLLWSLAQRPGRSDRPTGMLPGFAGDDMSDVGWTDLKAAPDRGEGFTSGLQGTDLNNLLSGQLFSRPASAEFSERMAHVFCDGDTFQVYEFVVPRLPVDVVDDEFGRDRSIEGFPYKSVDAESCWPYSRFGKAHVQVPSGKGQLHDVAGLAAGDCFVSADPSEIGYRVEPFVAQDGAPLFFSHVSQLATCGSK